MLSRDENIFLAKKLFVELVYNTAYIEGVNVTFPQTQAIIDGAIVNGVAVDDIETVLNLRDGWRYMLTMVEAPVTVEYLCSINAYVSRNQSLQWGVLRTGTIGISGTTWRPDPPVAAEVEEQLQPLLAQESPLDRATDFFCYAVRSQLFWDGNKRTSTIVASKILIEAGYGVLTIGKQQAVAFNEALLHLYDTADTGPLKTVLFDCIESRLETQHDAA